MSSRRRRGYSLIEIVVSTFLLLLLLGMLMGPYLVVENAVTRSDASTQFQQDLRAGLERLVHDVQGGANPIVIYPYPTSVGQIPELDFKQPPGGPLSNWVHVFVDSGTTHLTEQVFPEGTPPGPGATRPLYENVLGFEVSSVYFRPMWQSNYPIFGQWMDFTQTAAGTPPLGTANFPFGLPQNCLLVISVSGQPPGAYYDTSHRQPVQTLTTSVSIRS